MCYALRETDTYFSRPGLSRLIFQLRLESGPFSSTYGERSPTKGPRRQMLQLRLKSVLRRLEQAGLDLEG